MSFPGAIPSYTTPISTQTLKDGGHTALHIAEEADITALGTKIGTGSSTPASGLLLRGGGAGTSSWAQANLTSDVTGVLPQANGGTGTTLATGTGKAVYDTTPTVSNPSFTGGGSWTGSPSLTTPTIADFTNAIHTHANTANGGQLGFTALLSTIFSGQVSSYTNSGSGGGTGYTLNLGGVKLCWGTSAVFSISGSTATSFDINFPVGFFTTVQSSQASVSGTAANTANTYLSSNTASSTTSWSVYVITTAGVNAQNSFSWLVVGT